MWLLGRPDRSAQLYLLAGDGHALPEAHQRQLERFSATALACNVDIGLAHIREYCEVDEAGKGLLRAATRSEQLGMSAWSFHRVLKLARTIADIDTSSSHG